jgi:uncharacterized membrane protein
VRLAPRPAAGDRSEASRAAGPRRLTPPNFTVDYVNVPVWDLAEKEVVSGRVISYFGVNYIVPVVQEWPRTVVAVNIGGAVIPTVLSAYLIAVNGLWVRGAVATLVVSTVCHLLATPVPGLGIAIPGFVPPLVTAVVALVVAPRHAAAAAYVAGSLGTLIGADLMNLDKVQGLGAPIVSIGGAGTFDGIFLNGIVSVLLASLTPRLVPTR